MAKMFHNLAGLCRDLRAVALAAAEGDSEAEKLAYDFDDAMGLLDAFVEGDLDGGEDSDATASGDAPEDESPPVPRGQAERVRDGLRSMGAPQRGAAQHSTGDRMRAERARRGRANVVARPCGEPQAVPDRASRRRPRGDT